jgi:hypothetical protein
MSAHTHPIVALLLLAGCPGPDPVVPDGSTADYFVIRDKGTVACTGNNNGEIALDELLFEAGLSASYRINPPGTLVDVDAAGQVIEGKLLWDHASLAGVVAQLDVERVEGTWYEQHFTNPRPSFAIGVDLKADNLQVLYLDEAGDRMLLLGVVSREPDVTLLIYQPPVEIMRFPLRAGTKFSSTGKVENGLLNKLPVSTNDTYEVEVDNEGTVQLPTLDLRRSLRMRVKATVRTMGGQEVHNYQAQWFHECFGEVVRAVAQPRTDGTWPDPNLFKAQEYRRLSTSL